MFRQFQSEKNFIIVFFLIKNDIFTIGEDALLWYLNMMRFL